MTFLNACFHTCFLLNSILLYIIYLGKLDTVKVVPDMLIKKNKGIDVVSESFRAIRYHTYRYNESGPITYGSSPDPSKKSTSSLFSHIRFQSTRPYIFSQLVPVNEFFVKKRFISTVVTRIEL